MNKNKELHAQLLAACEKIEARLANSQGVPTRCPRCHGKGFTVQGDECNLCEGSGK